MSRNNITGTDYDKLTEQYVGKEEEYSGRISQELSADLVVVGSGAAGLPAAMEALDQQKSVIVLEHNAAVGGSGITTFGILGVNSHYQQEQHINVTVGQIAGLESNTYRYQTDGARMRDMLRRSGDNIGWLEQHGVKFSGVVDTYMADGHVRTYHWFEPHYSGANFIYPMRDYVLEHGGTILLKTEARKLTKDGNGKVNGLYAVDAEGKVIRIHAGAVILANGGFENCPDLLAARGYDPDHVKFFGAGGHDGSGLYLALDAGGANWMEHSSLLENPTNSSLKIKRNEHMNFWIGLQGNQVVVNEDGERFFNETAGNDMRAYPELAVRHQYGKAVFELFDDDILEAALLHVKRNAPRDYENAKVLLPDSLAGGSKGVWKADSLEELAGKTGIPAGRLQQTIEDYNRFAALHEDDEFGKDPEHLWPLHAPYYCIQYTDVQFITTFGGVHTGRHSETLDEQHRPVRGLYTIGSLGSEFWPGYYSIGIPGGANAFNVDSARLAVQDAVKQYL